jgi:O-antigen ligase
MRARPFLSLLVSVLLLTAALAGAVQWDARHRFQTRGWAAAFPEPVADTLGSGGRTLSRACVNASLTDYAGAELAWALDMIDAGGFDWIRQSISWAAVEPVKGAWDWTGIDLVLDAAGARGLQVLVVLEDPPDWAGLPPDPVAFARFASAVADRYGDRLAYYQIWHNPNLGESWGGYANAFGYADLLVRAAEAVRAVDPDARIILGSLAPTVETGDRNYAEDLFLTLLYAAGAGDAFDVVAVQPYGFATGPHDRRVERDVLNFSRAIIVREALVARGEGHKAIWATHFGWNSPRTDWPGPTSIWGEVSAAQQVTYTLEALERVAREWPWMGAMCLNGFQPRPFVEGRPVPDAQEHWGFALVGPDGTPDQLYTALQEWNTRPAVPSTGVYRADTDLAHFVGPWTLGPQGADMGEPNATRPSVSLEFEGTGVALTVRRGPYRAFLFVTIDGEPAPALPRDRDGNAYIVLYDPLAATVTVPLAENLTAGHHRVEVVAERGWGQWALADWRIVSEPEAGRAYPLGLVALVIVGLMGTGGIVWSAPRIRWGRWVRAARAAHARVAEWVAVVLSFLAGSVTLFAAWQTVMGDGIFRRLGDHGDLAALVLAAGCFYFSPWLLLTLGAGSVLVFLVFLRPDLGLALTLFAAPLYAMESHPLVYMGRSFSLAEIVLLPTVMGWGIHSLAGWAAARRVTSRRVWRRPDALRSLLRPLLLFVLVGIVATLAAQHRREALRELRLVILEPFLFFLVFVTLSPSARGLDRDRRRCVDALVASGLMVALIGLVRYFSGDVITAEGGTRRLLSVYGSPNNVGLYLGRVLPILGAMALWAGPDVSGIAGWRARWSRWAHDLLRDRRRVTYLVAAFPIAAALLLSLSRGAIVLGIPAAVVALGLLAGKPWRGVTLVLLLVGVLALIPFLQTPRFQGIFDLSQGTSGFRAALWFSSLRMIRDHPIVGVGPDNFLYAYRTRYVLPTAWEEFNLSHPHNIALDFAVRLGLPGLVAFLWTQVAFWRAVLPLRLRADRAARALGIGVAAAMVNVLAHGFVDAAYFLIDLAFVYMLLLGVAVWLQDSPEGPPSRPT